MDFVNKYWGICITCNHRPICLSFQNSLRIQIPVLHCEEFEDYPPSKEEFDVDPPSINEDILRNASGASSVNDGDNDEKITEKSIGLCINCENRKPCMFPAPAGGVWHCEEYC